MGGLDFHEQAAEEEPSAPIQPVLQHQWCMCFALQESAGDLKRGDAETSIVV